MSLLNKEDYNHVYICPNCGSSHINFSRERSIDGNAIVRCNDCCWSHREPNRLGYSNNQLYCQGVSAFNHHKTSEHIAYEKTERELLEEVLVELKAIRKYIDEQKISTEDLYYELNANRSNVISTPPGFKAPDIMCAVKEEESNESN